MSRKVFITAGDAAKLLTTRILVRHARRDLLDILQDWQGGAQRRRAGRLGEGTVDVKVGRGRAAAGGGRVAVLLMVVLMLAARCGGIVAAAAAATTIVIIAIVAAGAAAVAAVLVVIVAVVVVVVAVQLCFEPIFGLVESLA